MSHTAAAADACRHPHRTRTAPALRRRYICRAACLTSTGSAR